MSCGCGASHNHEVEDKKRWDVVCESFFNDLLSGDGAIRVKEAIEVGTKTVEYFRGTDFAKYVNKNGQIISRNHSDLLKAVNLDISAAPQTWVEPLGQYLIHQGFVVRAEHKPLNTATPETSNATDSKKDSQMSLPVHLRDSSKWPRRIGITRNNQKFDEAGFYAILYEKPTAFPHLLLAGIIVGVLCACMFPIWPFKLKICVWYLGVVFMTLMIILIIIRLILFVTMWFAGFDFWFFPTLFDEEAGIIDSFRPLYSLEKRDDDWLMIGARIFCAFLCVGSFYKLSETHSLSDMSHVATRGFLDVLEWGHQKLAASPSSEISMQMPNQPGGSGEVDPVKFLEVNRNYCAQYCKFTDYEELKTMCLTDCNCIEDLWSSKCWQKCMPIVKDEMQGVRDKCLAGEMSFSTDDDDNDDGDADASGLKNEHIDEDEVEVQGELEQKDEL